MKTILTTCLCAVISISGIAAQAIVAAEYYLDADPGPGNGTAISVNASGSVSLVGNVPAATIAALPEGIHTLVCRVKDADGDWSVAFARPFYKQNTYPSATPAPIVAAEYFIDSDPGPGNGIIIPVTASVSPQLAVNIPAGALVSLPEGIHTLVCRVRDSDGDWSVAFARPFYKSDPLPESERFLARLEYQWFAGGVAAGTPQSVIAPAGAVSATWLPELPLPSAVEGSVFQLVVTAFDTFGNQSHPATRIVTVSPPPTLAEAVQNVPANLRPPGARLSGDPLTTLQKYFLGTDPAQPSTGKEIQLVSGSLASAATLRSFSLNAPPQIGLKFRRSRYIQGVSGVVESSSTLEENSWRPLTTTERITPLDPYTDEVTLFANPPGPGINKQFLRLKITPAP